MNEGISVVAGLQDLSSGPQGTREEDLATNSHQPATLPEEHSLWHRAVVRPPVLAGELSLSCARLMAGRVTTSWVKRPLLVNQHGQLSQPSLRGRLDE